MMLDHIRDLREFEPIAVRRVSARTPVRWAVTLWTILLTGEASILLRADEPVVGHDTHSSVGGQAVGPRLPFPHNRVRDFYAHQARRYLTQPRPWPELFAAFPGLDGGSFGHWGQNPESDNYDLSLNSIDHGGLLAQITRHFGTTTMKAVNFRFGPHDEFSAVFDPEKLTYADCWRGGFIRWRATRFGITSGVDAHGEQLIDFRDDGWQVPAGIETRYLGFFRNGRHVVFHYRIGNTRIYDRLIVNQGIARRALSFEQPLPNGVRPGASLPTTVDDGQTLQVARGAVGRWNRQVVTTAGQRGADSHAFAIDTLTIPDGQQNPFRTPMRVGGFDFMPDGRLALSTLTGDVWLVDGVDDELKQIRWQRIAAGLNQPLGVVVQHGKILVICRDQLTRLHDLNGDNEADYYECVTNQFPTAGGEGFAMSLNQDASGKLYWFTYSNNFGITQFDPASGLPPTVIATGLRATNGIGVSPDSRMVFATVQEGTWTPASAIFEVRPGSYHGFMGPRDGHGPHGYDLPLCFIPRGVDNSAGEIAVLPNDQRLGPLAGQIVGTSFGYCQHYLILRELIGGRSQGGVVPLPGEFLSGAHRLRFHPRDGYLYVAGTDGWQSYAQAPGSLQRLRYTHKRLPLPIGVESRANGLIVHFNSAIDPQSVSLDRVFCEQWNYLYSAAYGSPEYSVKQPGRLGHDRVDVKSLHLFADGQKLFVEIPSLHPVMQLHVYLELNTSDGERFPADLYYSVFHLGEPFKSFPSYQPTAKAADVPFPVATNFPRDARLIRQENLGKEFSTLQGVTSLHMDAVSGLRFEPNVLRVRPSERVALVLRNNDAGMPHNWVLARPDRLDAIGQQAMQLAADPRAYATNYVPEDDGVLAFTPILDPHDQYTVYFDSPPESGAYPFLCTFPGHWQVMRGVLYVLEDDQPLPEKTPFSLERQFVRLWELNELAADADSLSQRSYQSGHQAFHVAGCAQCHPMAGHGVSWGLDLTRIHERFQGAKLLQQILEPSSEINPSYQTVVVHHTDGTTVSGLMLAENEQELTLLTNPLLPNQVTRIDRNDVEARDVSTVSTMPTGLLMTLTRDEILDLLAYLTAGGRAEHGVFGGELNRESGASER